MLTLLLESVARSLALGGAVYVGLKLLRARNPHDEMTAWRLVLAASLAMPLLVQLMAPWATVTISAPLAQIVMPEAANVDQIDPPTSLQEPGRASKPLTEDTLTSAPAEPAANETARGIGRSIGWQAWITVTYVLVGGTLLLRMLIGIVLGFRLVRTAQRLAKSWTAGCDVRISNAVSMPVTFGSTILLPPNCIDWGTVKRQAVLSHEKSHIDHGDFTILMLASLHRAVFWFNPLSWWLLRRLTELAEIISDDAAVTVLRDQHSYAAILLDVAGSARPAAIGVAMARPHTVRWRIERLLSATAPATPTTPRKRLLLTLALLPLVAMAAIGIARGAPPALAGAVAQVAPLTSHADADASTDPSKSEEQQKLGEDLRRRAEEPRSRLPLKEQPAPPVRPPQQRSQTCFAVMARLRDAGRALSLPALPNPRLEDYRPSGFANRLTQVTYDWPRDTAQAGVLSCLNTEFVFYRMQADTAALRLRNAGTPRGSRDLQAISAAIFASTGERTNPSTLQLLFAQQPQQPNHIDATLTLPGGYMVWLSYDNFAITYTLSTI